MLTKSHSLYPFVFAHLHSPPSPHLTSPPLTSPSSLSSPLAKRTLPINPKQKFVSENAERRVRGVEEVVWKTEECGR